MGKVVLASSASYLLTDHMISSEGLSCYNIFRELEKFGYSFEAVSARVDVKKALKNTRFHEVGSFLFKPTSNLMEKYVSHTEFIARSLLKCRRILRERMIDAVHHMFPSIYGQSFSPLTLLRQTRGRPFIFGPVSAYFFPRPLDERALFGLTSKLHLETVRNSDAVVAITERVKELYSEVVDEEKIWVIPLGVDANLFKPARESFSQGYCEVLSVGYLYRLKGVEFLLKAMRIVLDERRDVVLRLIGEGPEEENLRLLAEKLNIEKNVIFMGFVPHNEISMFYERCQTFCFPTLGEPFGKAILEAMACGKPVVASRSGGPAEIMENGVTGLLVPPGDPEALASAIMKILSDDSYRKRMGRRAREAVLKKYSWRKIAESYNKLYESII